MQGKYSGVDTGDVIKKDKSEVKSGCFSENISSCYHSLGGNAWLARPFLFP